ncbi:hypothetical protein [Paraburkholderia bannensis]|uniref:hypothetical protein n=1 Tax=Paraburkholderia bannensis TaxID=765414 RepID=UPI002ABDC804|nr:hypothetical protein [Paraburkholderia bannensis]
MNMTHPFRAITDRSSLEHTAYVELMVGAYADLCWNEGSLFFEEEVFGYLEPTIKKYVPTYDHYAFTQVSMTDWEKIIADLANIRDALGIEALRVSALAQMGVISTRELTEHVDASSAALSALITQIEQWTRPKRLEYDCVTILGL